MPEATWEVTDWDRLAARSGIELRRETMTQEEFIENMIEVKASLFAQVRFLQNIIHEKYKERSDMAFFDSPPVYKYKGWLFEIHRICGPCPVDEDGNPRNGNIDEIEEFWHIWEQFEKETDKRQYLVHKGT